MDGSGPARAEAPAAARRQSAAPQGPRPQAPQWHRPESATTPAHDLPFVEVSLGGPRAAPTEVEIQRPDGTRLRITYRDAAPALASLVQTFLESR